METALPPFIGPFDVGLIAEERRDGFAEPEAVRGYVPVPDHIVRRSIDELKTLFSRPSFRLGVLPLAQFALGRFNGAPQISCSLLHALFQRVVGLSESVLGLFAQDDEDRRCPNCNNFQGTV